MNIGVLSKILGHNSIKVTLDSYGTIIDELMLRSVKDLKGKLTTKTERSSSERYEAGKNAQQDLIYEVKKVCKN
jgi:hypothetical protein